MVFLPMNLAQAVLSLCLRRSLTRASLALALIGPATMSLAEDEVKVSPAQAQTLGVRVVHPVSSRTDQTLPYPAQIVIPTPQLWVVSAPVAGMVNALSVARGDRVKSGQPLVTLESPSFVSLQRDYLHAFAQDVLAAQQLRRNTDLFEGKAVPQRVLEASQAEARQASIAVAERRQMLRLSGVSDAAISLLTSETAIAATVEVAAPQQATVVEIVVSPGQRVEQAAPLVKLARLSTLWAEIAIPASSIRAIRPGARVEIDGYASLAGSFWYRKQPMRRLRLFWCEPKCQIRVNYAPGKPPQYESAFFPPVKVPGRSPTARSSDAETRRRSLLQSRADFVWSL